MDDKSFQAAKKKIIGSWKKYKCLTDISAELEGYKNDPNVKEYGEKSWSFQDQDECCQEFGWPDNEAHHDQVIILLQDLLKFKLGWDWEIKKSTTDTVPHYHSGSLYLLGKTKSGGGVKKSKSVKALFGLKKSKSVRVAEISDEEEEASGDMYDL